MPETGRDSYRLQAAAILDRWRARRRPVPAAPVDVPERAELPPPVAARYRSYAWVIHEQRLFALVLAALAAAAGLVWAAALQLRHKAPLVVRSGPTLKEAAAAYAGSAEISYDQVAFFLHASVPLLYEANESGHPWLPLAEGLVAPQIYEGAERRLSASDAIRRSHRMTQSLAIDSIDRFVADPDLGRAAAEVRGRITVTAAGAEAREFPWAAQVILASNPSSRLDPYPFYLLDLDVRKTP